ncbi:MAG: tRNA preQ1(34) S-adenosylmethionine ribosyltransferase-isomerase QueA [Candidatus Falkowbacteria bacterium]
MRMDTAIFDYNLPKNLIAQQPAKQRDRSQLFIYNRANDEIEHKKFFELIDYLKKGDILVLNNTKVLPARLFGKKEQTGGNVEVLLLRQLTARIWECLLRVRGNKKNTFLVFPKNLSAQILKPHTNETWQVQFDLPENDFKLYLQKYGAMPLPPYIKSNSPEGAPSGQASILKKQYQTIFAKYDGSAAAPTAGLHFTKELLSKIRQKGVAIKYITLHVGLGTFAPVREQTIEQHKMHSEVYKMSQPTYKTLLAAKKQGQRIIAVGTTVVRTLETVFNASRPRLSGETDIFIYPGYDFKMVDAMITNFHLPKSTLLMLLAAFVGREKLMELYKIAIEKQYRFYSFGDAMFIE